MLVVDHFKATFAQDKSTHVGTDQQLANKLCAELCQGQAEAATAVENLGCDYQAGAPRASRHAGKKRKARMARLNQRMVIIKRMQHKTNRQKERLHRIACCGARPMASCGDKVRGFSDHELKVLRRRLASTLAPTSRGSLSSKLAALGDPASAEAVGPATAWAAECWRCATGDTKCLSKPEMVAAWKAAREATGGWSQSKGVARRCWLTLARLGWTMPGPFLFRDHRGLDIPLLETSPALVGHYLAAANQRALEKAVGSKVWPRARNSRACFDTVHRALASNKHDALGKALIKSISCGSCWTAHRKKLSGYDVDDICPLCGAEGDTVHHRLWICPVVDCFRRQALKSGKTDNQHIIGAMAAKDPKNPLATRALYQHPAEEAPLPATKGVVTVTGWSRDAYGQPLHGPMALSAGLIDGDTFPDGAAFPHPVKELSRAGWAAVVVDGGGQVLVEARGPVPAPLPQTAQAAEYSASTAIAGILSSEARLYPDCMNVVKDFNRPMVDQLQAKRRYAGLLKGAQQHVGWTEAAEATWQKAHLSMTTLAGEELRRAMGNDAADKAAKAAAKECHPAIPPDLDERAKHLDTMAEATCAVAAAVLRHFPADTVKAERVEPAGVRAKRRAGGHAWTMFWGGLRCEHCWTTANAAAKREERDRFPCAGLPPAIARVIKDPKGHQCVVLRFAPGQPQGGTLHASSVLPAGTGLASKPRSSRRHDAAPNA